MILSRRTFLRGAGVALALPALEAMIPRRRARAAGLEKPVRFLAFYVPNGIHMPAWTPATEGRDFALPPILQPLEPLRNSVLVLSGLENRAAMPQGDGAGDHARGTASFLTCTHVAKTAGDDIRNGVSIDQAIARSLEGRTRFASLELGIDGGGSTGDCDSGYACAYARNIAWSGPQTPVAREVNPVALFDRLFGTADPRETAEAIERRRQRRLSVLDFVREDAKRLQSQVGMSDRRKLDEYLTGVRELEVRLASGLPASSCGTPERPERSDDFRTRVQLMTELMVLAFQCDLTRVITFMLGNATSGRVYDFLGIDRGHHDISHHMNDPASFELLTRIDTWEVEQLAGLLGRLAAVTGPEGESLLDDSIVFFSSEIEDGNSHSHSNLPVLLAGGGGGTIDSGRHLRFSQGTPIANLFLAIGGRMGLELDRFGDDGVAPLAI